MKYNFIFLFFILILVNCRSDRKGSSKIDTRSQAEILYGRYCKGCHGWEGERQFRGAANLKTSSLDEFEIAIAIAEGKGKMVAYQKFLTKEEILLLSGYVNGLRKN